MATITQPTTDLTDKKVKELKDDYTCDNIHSQLSDKCIKIYDGNFEDIFTQPVTV